MLNQPRNIAEEPGFKRELIFNEIIEIGKYEIQLEFKQKYCSVIQVSNTLNIFNSPNSFLIIKLNF